MLFYTFRFGYALDYRFIGYAVGDGTYDMQSRNPKPCQQRVQLNQKGITFMRNYYSFIAIMAITIGCAVFNCEVSAQETHFTKEIEMQNYQVIQKPAVTVIGIECRTSNASEAGPHDIPKHWEKFYQENTISKIPNKASNEVIALYCDYEGDYTQPYSLVIGCPVSSLDDIPEGMVAKTIPAGAYAIFRATGEHPKVLIETWGQIWQQQNLDRTYTGDYEVYGDKFISGSPKELDVYIAIEK